MRSSSRRFHLQRLYADANSGPAQKFPLALRLVRHRSAADAANVAEKALIRRAFHDAWRLPR